MPEHYGKTVYFACILWIAFSFFLFLSRPYRKAILLSLLSGWMFLPIFSITILGLPDINKTSLVVISLFLFCAVSEARGHVKRPKFSIRKFDLIVIFYLCSYLVSACLNDLGFYEGFSGVLGRIFEVCIPYLIGRLYFSNLSSHALLARTYLFMSLLYLPLAMFELRFSPQLHNMIYGYQQHTFGQTIRSGTWRPMVFLSHGLEVALWFALASLIGMWLIRAGIFTRGFTILGVGLLFIITIIGQSWGSIILLVIALLTLISCHFFKIGLPFVILFLFPSFYMTNRILDIKLEKPLIEVARGVLPLLRFRSMTFRVDQEYTLVARANEKMFFGWGRFGGFRIRDKDGVDRSVTDSRWIIEYGTGGLSSLLPLILIFTFPVIGLYRLAPASLWHTKNFAPSAALAVGTASVLHDIMLNSFCSPIHFLIIGALTYPFVDQSWHFVGMTTTPSPSSPDPSYLPPPQ